MSEWWTTFRSWPWWGQALLWILFWPGPAGMWAASRTGEQGRRATAIAVVASLFWLFAAIGAVVDDRDAQDVVATASTTTAEVGESEPEEVEEELSDGDIPDPISGDDAPGSDLPTSAAAGIALVKEIEVAPEGSRSGYQRELFAHWSDLDGDRCDTRSEVLIDEDLNQRAQVDQPGCAVVAGDWLSIYDNYSTTDPTELHVDHVVALAEAWDSGASDWAPGRREAFANDLGYDHALVAVTEATNVAKGDKDPADWQPSSDAAWCWFATAWTNTKIRWELTADKDEVDALRNIFRKCDPASTTTVAPATTSPPPPPPPTSPPQTSPPPPQPPPEPPPSGGGTVHPGAYCSPEGASGTSKNGVPMTCASTSCEGKAYDRPRWRRTHC